MTTNEFEKLKTGDTIYYVTEHSGDSFVGESKVAEKHIINGHRMLSFYPDEKVESDTTLFSYAYEWEGFVVRFYYENVFLTKKEAKKKIKEIKEPRKLTEELPW